MYLILATLKIEVDFFSYLLSISEAHRPQNRNVWGSRNFLSSSKNEQNIKKLINPCFKKISLV